MARSRLLVLAVAAGVLMAGPPASAQEPEPVSEVRLKFDGAVELAAARDAGLDADHGATRVPDGIEIDAHVTQKQLLSFVAAGAEVVQEGEQFEWSFQADAQTALADPVLPRPAAPTVRIVRADYFTTKGQGFLYVEARTTTPTAPGITMRLENDSGPGTAFESGRNMTAFNDSGVYMFHRNQFKVNSRPDSIRVTSSTGGVAVGKVSDWLRDVTPLTATPGYKWNFIQEYKHPQQLYSRFREIAAQNPEIAQIIETPNKTNGYQRKAQATIGSTTGATNQNAAVVVSSAAWGHEGGNGIAVSFVNQEGADKPLSVVVNDRAITVNLAKNAAGNLASTANDVAAALVAQSNGLIGRAHRYRTTQGTGIVQPTTIPIVLTDFLDQKRTGAPAGEVPRGPNTVPILRIGKHRDGSKPGVLIQAQDHAREWVPATITAETAERLIANYPNDPATKEIIENVDIFLIASNNPDGANYSFYNFASQRRNMTNHCPDAQADPGNRNAWGVDLNRNFRVGSGFDGFSGASTNCTNDTYQGPAKLSEPEAKNTIWAAETYRNIKFFMSVHSNGGQLFWQPGAYIANGRITTPRPPLGHEAFYWQSADRILSQVRASRQTVVTPENVGGSSDVLYSSAGNVREDLYFNYGVYAFGWEVGGAVYNPATGTFPDGSFQPPWVGNPELLSGHSETMEYTNGVMEMFRVAADWGRDKTAATSSIVSGAQSDSPKGIRFETNEPATIYYTMDGSEPTLQSPRYNQTEFREGGEEIWVEQTTTFRWISVDAAGNLESAKSARVQIGEESGPGATVPATLSLTLGPAASFGAFQPGVAREYTATTGANIISTAGDASLSVSDPGRMANGTFLLPQPLRVEFSKSSWTAPVSNDPVTITFKQAIAANDALRTGTYSKTLTFTLSTTTP